MLCQLSYSRFAAECKERLTEHSQSARVVKGVDLRSTAGNCAWVQTAWLTIAKHKRMLEHFITSIFEPSFVRPCGLMDKALAFGTRRWLSEPKSSPARVNCLCVGERDLDNVFKESCCICGTSPPSSVGRAQGS